MRKALSLGLGLVAVLAIGSMASAANPTNALSHYWDFEDVVAGSTTDALDTARVYNEGATAVADVSLHCNYGTYATGVGRDGGVSVTQSNSGCANTDPTPLTNLSGSATPGTFTFEGWFKYTGFANTWAGFIGNNGSTGGPIVFQDCGTYPWSADGITSGSGGTPASDGKVVQSHATATGSYYFIAISCDLAAQTMKAWVTADGQTSMLSYGLDDTTYTTAYAGTVGLMLGNQRGKYNAFGQWDWVAIWDQALDPSLITDHMINGLQLTTGGGGPTFHPGDANGDGIVDLQDFGLLKDNFGATEAATWAMGDFTGDGAIDLQDFGVLKDHFGHTNGDSPVTAVPEPATMSLLALAGVAVLRRRK